MMNMRFRELQVAEQRQSAKRGQHVRRLWVGFALLAVCGTAARAVADNVVASRHGAVLGLSSPRDPDLFLNDIAPVMPPPVVLLTREDAVAQEILSNSPTLSEAQAVRTAQALCDEARTLGYDPLLFLAVIHIESYYNHLAVSPVGAEGLMQLMPVPQSS